MSLRSSRPEVLVVGAGAVGASVAYELAARGVEVHVLDQHESPAQGCSRANAGLLVPSRMEPLTTSANLRAGLTSIFRPANPFRVTPRPTLVPWLLRFADACRPGVSAETTRILRALAQESFAMHAAYGDHGLGTSFTRAGFIDAFHDEVRLMAALTTVRRFPDSLQHQLLSSADARDRIPGARDLAGGIYYPHEGHCDPHAYTRALLAGAVAMGASVTTAARVTQINASAGAVNCVRTIAGDFRPGTVVVAAGDGSRGLVRPLGLRLPIEPAKGYIIELESAADSDPAMPLGLREQKIVITPLPGRLRLAGTLELVGPNQSVDERRARAVRRAAITALPHLAQREVISTSVGMRPCSPDGKPLVGRVRSLRNLVLATGHGTDGIILAPVTGRLVAEDYTGTIPGHRYAISSALSPDRFVLAR